MFEAGGRIRSDNTDGTTTYRYAQDEPGAYAAGENYLPAGVRPDFYHPTDRGLEAKIRERLEALRELDRAAGSDNEGS